MLSVSVLAPIVLYYKLAACMYKFLAAKFARTELFF